MSMDTILAKLLASLPPRPISKSALDALVSQIPAHAKGKDKHAEWEYVLRKEIFKLAGSEAEALKQGDGKTYYQSLFDRLDVILTLSEFDICDQSLPLLTMEDLFEVHTIASCVHLFSWLELRSVRLTKDMVPQRGKSLTLLRALNELLRRLSKTGETAKFCGRILNYLSRVIDITDKSGINLRGDYGPPWEGTVKDLKRKADEMEDIEVVPPTESEEEKKRRVEAEEQDAFYDTFWSVQNVFAQPNLFATGGPTVLSTFKTAVNAIIPRIVEATKKERLMMGNRNGTVGAQKKRIDSEEGSATAHGGTRDYFFTKFLTSPDLLQLEMADVHFRRQILFQLLILLQHLLLFTPQGKAQWSNLRGRNVQKEFTLEEADTKWVKETWAKAMEELKATSPNGRLFQDTAQAILERERGWILWKSDMCQPFVKPPLDPSEEEDARAKREKKLEPLAKWPHPFGTEGLTELWIMGLRELEELEDPADPGSVQDFAKLIKREDARADLRRKQLAARALPKPAPVLPAPETPVERSNHVPDVVMASPSKPSTPTPFPLAGLPPKPTLTPSVPLPQPIEKPTAPAAPPPQIPLAVPAPVQDEQLSAFEERKQSLTWRALRIAAHSGQLHHFSKIGLGDVDMLLSEINKSYERRNGRSDAAASVATPSAVERAGHDAETPHASQSSQGSRGMVVDGDS